MELFDALMKPLSDAFQLIEANISITAPAGILLLGLVTGLRHSFEPDHVAAVSTMVASSSSSSTPSSPLPKEGAGKSGVWSGLKKAPVLGAIWGVGHTASLFAAGLIVLLLATAIPESLSAKMEFGVGIMLVVLAATTITGWSLGRFFRGIAGLRGRRGHRHIHNHGPLVHDHDHDHRGREHSHAHRSLIVGVVHGLAGSGALMLFVLPTIHSLPLGLAYIGIFGAGSIAGMAGVSTLVGIPFARLGGSSAKATLVLRYVAGVITMAIGASLMYELASAGQIFE